MKTLCFAAFILIFFLHAEKAFSQVDIFNDVNPFTGTDAHGHTFPGATLPFGMVQLSPDTRLDGWDGCSGYHFSDSVIYGFSHTHLSGTGCSDYGDVLLMPFKGMGSLFSPEYASPFHHATEKAIPGYYSVFLEKDSVFCELTTTFRTGMHKYTFGKTESPVIILDLTHRDKLLHSWVEISPSGEVIGLRRSAAWAKDQKLFFCIRFNTKIVKTEIYKNNQLQSGNKITGDNIKVIFRFEPVVHPILVKVGISGVDETGAQNNLNTENPGWNFDSVKTAAYSTWEKELNKIRVEGGSSNDRKTFYTSLYHCMISPNLFSDCDGRYRGMDDTIHKAENFDYYTVFSLWDTFRALHPLLTILDEKRTRDFILTFLAQYQQSGSLPVWELWGNETNCMIGYHSAPVITDAIMKGIPGLDAQLALEAMKSSAKSLNSYIKNQFIPANEEHESVSKTLEYAYDDWCIAQTAKQLGKTKDFKEFIKRAQYYKNIFDWSSGFMRPRENGRWLIPFDPTEVNNHYTEANSWQYSFFVPHDVNTWMGYLGGAKNLSQKLDTLFKTPSKTSGRTQVDITGMIGQYAHGNEPSHSIVSLYNFCGQAWKAQKTIKIIRDSLYSPKPDGLCGNEDCGQMSAWYVFSALGFYPFCPGDTNYIIGTPLFPKASLCFENGNKLQITVRKNAPSDFYVQSASWNNAALQKSFISHQKLARGGTLHFEMAEKPNPLLWSRAEECPVNRMEAELMVIAPWFEYSKSVFKDSVLVKMSQPYDDASVYYSLNNSNHDTLWTLYSSPLYISSSCTLLAKTFAKSGETSSLNKAVFHKMDSSHSVKLLAHYNPQYHAGGAEGLIDGIRGNTNWRLGGWQGFQDTDFEAILDLGVVKTCKFAGAGFLQDARSWIWLPKELEVSISDDTSSFAFLANITHSVADTSMETTILNLTIEKTFTARYIRFKAKNFGTIPDWHPGKGSKAFIFIDELLVE